jgi:hypothetical protein
MISPSLTVTDTWASNTISLNYWFYPTSNNIQLLSELGQQSVDGSGWHYSMLEINSMGNVTAKFYDGVPITSVNQINLNAWNHIYFAEDSQGGHTFELNGIPTTGNPTYTRSKPTTEYFAIGGYDATNMGATGGFVGKIGWLEIHDYTAGSTYLNTKAKFIDPVLIVNLDVANPSSYTAQYTVTVSDVTDSGTKIHIPTAFSANIGNQIGVGYPFTTQWGGYQGTVTNISTGTGSFGSEWIITISTNVSIGFSSGSNITFGNNLKWNMLGTANQATLVNSPTYDSTGGVKAINFTGGSYATLPADVYFDQDFTIIAWVKVTSVTSWARIIDFGNGPNGDNVLLAASDGPSGNVALRSGTTQFDSTTVLTPGTWYHITGRVKTDGRADIFINGSVDATNYGTTLPASVTRTNCYIAKSNWDSDAYLDGLIGELRIYRGALSDAKVYDDYYDTRSKYAPPTLALNLEATASYLDSTTAPTTWTDSVGNIPFTLHGGVGYNSGNGGYLTFQAASSRYADSTTGPALTQWAVETWMYWNGQNVGSNPCIVSDQFGGKINYALGTLDQGGLQAGHFNGGWHTTPGGYTLPATNSWYHIVGTYNGQDVKLYVNGVCVAIRHDPGITPEKGNAGINLMRRWDNPDYWGGRLSIVRIFSGEMGAAEVKLRYDATKSRFGLT